MEDTGSRNGGGVGGQLVCPLAAGGAGTTLVEEEEVEMNDRPILPKM